MPPACHKGPWLWDGEFCSCLYLTSMASFSSRVLNAKQTLKAHGLSNFTQTQFTFHPSPPNTLRRYQLSGASVTVGRGNMDWEAKCGKRMPLVPKGGKALKGRQQGLTSLLDYSRLSTSLKRERRAMLTSPLTPVPQAGKSPRSEEKEAVHTSPS